MRFTRDVIFPVLLAIIYFTVAYFAVMALVPGLALQAGLLAIILAMSAYLFLRATGSDETGIPIGILIMFTLYLFCGRDYLVVNAVVGLLGELTQGIQ